MTRLVALVALVSTALLCACAGPTHPFGQPTYVLKSVPTYRPSSAARPVSGPVVAVGAFDDHTVAPVGAGFEGEADETGVMNHTYHFWALVPKVRQELRERLRRRGINAFLHDNDIGEPVPFPSPPFAPGSAVLRGVIERFGYSRHRQGWDVVAADIELTLVGGSSGKVLWKGRKQVRLRTPSGRSDPFALLADALATSLAQDRTFVAGLNTTLTAMSTNGGAR